MVDPQPDLTQSPEPQAPAVNPASLEAQSAGVPRGEPIQNQVHVIDPSGEWHTIDLSEVQEAVQKYGFTVPSDQQVQDFKDAQTYGGTSNAVKAFGLGALNTGTFGLGPLALTKTGMMDPKTGRMLEKYHPTATGLGEAAGIGASLLVPGAGEAEAAGAGARAAEAGASSVSAMAKLTNPVKAVSGIGKGVTEAAAPAAENIAGLLANPETSPLMNKIMSGAIAHGTGAAVEGAAYGVGQSINEYALGDPDLNGSKVMANIGMGAFLGGAMGSVLGPMFDAAEGKIARYVPGSAGVTTTGEDTFKEGVMASRIPAAEKDSIFKDIQELSKPKENADQIVNSYKELGIDPEKIMPEQLSDSKLVQRAAGVLTDAQPTWQSIKRQKIYSDVYHDVDNVVQDVLGGETQYSKAELGDILKKSLTDKLEQENAPIKSLYDEIGQYSRNVPLNKSLISEYTDKIKNIIQEQNLVKGRPQYQFVNDYAEALKDVKNLDQLKQFRSSLQRDFSPENRYVSGQIKQQLDGLEESGLKSFAEQVKDPQMKSNLSGLLDKVDTAKESYKEFRGKMEQLGDVLGKRKIYGTQDFIDFINDLTPEKMTDKLFAKGNSQFLKFFNEEFPDEMKLLADHQKGKLFQAAMKDEHFRPNKVFSELDKLEPEAKSVLFRPEELKKIDAAKQILDSFPKHVNPSNTANISAFREFFEHPIKAATANIRDVGIDQFIKMATRMNPEEGKTVGALLKVNQMSQRTTQQISSAAKNIFRAAPESAVPFAALAGTKMVDSMNLSKDQQLKNMDKIQNRVNELNNNPQKLQDTIETATNHLYQVAPQMASAMQQTALRGIQFLGSKLPKGAPPRPLSPKFVPSQLEISKFNRYYHTVQEPLHVMKLIPSGAITSEHIETLQSVYPQLYNEMKSQVMDQMSNHIAKGNDIPYRTKMSLTLFMGQDMDHSLEPYNIVTNQNAMMNMGQEQAKGQMQNAIKTSQKGLSEITKSQRSMTAMQQIAAGKET